MSKLRIHFVRRDEPIPQHGKDQMSCCGLIVPKALPIVIVPDAMVVSIAIMADQFGSRMCRECKLIEPNEGYIYFVANAEEVLQMRRAPEFAEVS